MRADLLRFTITTSLTVLLVVASVIVWTTDSGGAAQTGGGVTSGQDLFLAKGCSGCHTISGVVDGGNTGPNLTRLSDRAATGVDGLDAEEYVRQSLLDPQAFIAPGFENAFVEMPTLPLTEDELETLTEFLLIER